MSRMTKRKVLQPKRHRSPSFPAIGLEAALKRAKSLHLAADDRAVPLPIATGAWGYQTGSSLAGQVVAALRQYGLVQTGGRGPQRSVKLSPAVVQILTSKSNTQRMKLLRAAVVRPKIHGELWKLVKRKAASRRDIVDYLVNQRTQGKFNPKRVDRFIDQFRSSLIFAELCSNDFLFVALEPAARPVGSLAAQAGLLSRADSLPEAAVREFLVPLDGGGNAVIRLPLSLSTNDLERIAATLISWKTALVPGHSPISAIVASTPDECTQIPDTVNSPPNTGRPQRRILTDPTKALGD
jgi:hypothetical protein